MVRCSQSFHSSKLDKICNILQKRQEQGQRLRRHVSAGFEMIGTGQETCAFVLAVQTAQVECKQKCTKQAFTLCESMQTRRQGGGANV
eukprot:3212296-Rhodomonas_salina.2